MTDTLELFQKLRRRHRGYLLASLAILIAASGGYVDWQHRATAKFAAATASSAPAPAVAVSLRSGEMCRSISPVLARCRRLTRSRSRRESTANLIKVAFTEGQGVKAGDLLAQIEPRPFQAAYDQAVAKKVQDEANLANAKLDLQRFADLAARNFATQQQLDTQRATVAQLEARSLATRRRSTAPKPRSTTRRLPPRSPAALASISSIRATSCMRPTRRDSSS